MNKQQVRAQALYRAIGALEDYRDQGVIATIYDEQELPKDIIKIEQAFQRIIDSLSKRLTALPIKV